MGSGKAREKKEEHSFQVNNRTMHHSEYPQIDTVMVRVSGFHIVS